MKRLLGLLLVMGMGGCGGGAPPPGDVASPQPSKSSQEKVNQPPAQAADADPSVASESTSPTTPTDTVDDVPTQAADAGNAVDNLVLTSDQITEALELRMGNWKYSDGETLTGRWKEKKLSIEIKGQFGGKKYLQTVKYDRKTNQFVGIMSLAELDGSRLVETRHNRWDPKTKTLRIRPAGSRESEWTLSMQKTGPNSVSCEFRTLRNGRVVSRENSTGVRTSNTP